MSSPTEPQVDSPLEIRHIPFTYDNNDADASAVHLVQELDRDWKEAEGPIELHRFTDGITNTLTKAVKRYPGRSDAEIDEDAILIRAYGKGTAVLIDRQREMRAHNLLANVGLAPPLLARFDNGLMYRFIKGTVCTPADLRNPEIYRAVARRLGEWHGSLPISAITVSPKPNGVLQNKQCAPTQSKSTRPTPNLWTVMQQWINALPSSTEDERRRIEVLGKELPWLAEKFGDTPGLIEGRDYVFGHCDLLSGNVIQQRSPSCQGKEAELSVSFIDYEYAMPTPAAFDIANHFAEWAGFECDHSTVPTKSERLDFLKHYVGSFRSHSLSDVDQHVEIDLRNDVVRLNNQVDLFRGVPGFYWGIWALIQAQISQIDFDYASYAEVRLGEYWGWKAELDGSRVKSGGEMTVREKRWAEA